MAFKWNPSLACNSCYKILLELRQLSSPKVSFEKAGKLKIKQLNFFPLSTNTPDIKELAAQLLIQQYIQLLDRNYILKPQNNSKWKDIRKVMLEILMDGDKTVADLAEAIDALIMFDDELGA